MHIICNQKFGFTFAHTNIKSKIFLGGQKLKINEGQHVVNFLNFDL